MYSCVETVCEEAVEYNGIWKRIDCHPFCHDSNDADHPEAWLLTLNAWPWRHTGALVTRLLCPTTELFLEFRLLHTHPAVAFVVHRSDYTCCALVHHHVVMKSWYFKGMRPYCFTNQLMHSCRFNLRPFK